MQFNKDILKEYLLEAPIPLALERAWECEIYKRLEFNRPILDLGCGDGIFAKILFSEKIDVGLDPLEFELEYAKKLNVYSELLNARGDKIPKEDNTFNTIYSNSVLEHISDIEPVICEMYRVLKQGGKLYVTLPTNNFDRYTIGSILFSIIPPFQKAYRRFFNKFWKHYHYYDRAGWIRLFEKNGFKFKSVQEYGTKGQCMYNDFMVPLTIPNYIVKKVLNRYFLFLSLRKFYSPFLVRIIKRKVKIHLGLITGGLIFLSFEK